MIGTLLIAATALGITATNPANKHVNTIAHFTVSATMTHVGYVACRRIFDSKVGCLVAGSVASFAVGIVKEVTDPKFDKKDVLTNVGGIGLSVGLISLEL